MSTAQTTTVSSFETEVQKGERFRFGKNWQQFLSVLNEDRIGLAVTSLQNMLGATSLEGMSFVDVGSGSGLFSLSAMRLGAQRVCSIDFDPQSVQCARELKRRYFPEADNWEIMQGSVLDQDLLSRLGSWDVVYSWGVLHHTGQMWKALDNVTPLVAPGGRLFISIYNDMGSNSRRWRKIKAFYNWNAVGRLAVTAVCVPYFFGRTAVGNLLKGRAPWYGQGIRERGMSRYYDVIDWIGGYPYEVAKPEEIFEFFRQRGFVMERMKTCGGGRGCNEYVFRLPSRP